VRLRRKSVSMVPQREGWRREEATDYRQRNDYCVRKPASCLRALSVCPPASEINEEREEKKLNSLREATTIEKKRSFCLSINEKIISMNHLMWKPDISTEAIIQSILLTWKLCIDNAIWLRENGCLKIWKAENKSNKYIISEEKCENEMKRNFYSAK